MTSTPGLCTLDRATIGWDQGRRPSAEDEAMSQNRNAVWEKFFALLDSPDGLPHGEAHPCPYLPDREAKNRAFLADRIEAELYQQLMDRGFRRSGSLFYQPVCPRCRECRPIRIPVAQFTPSRSQRRARRRNQDLNVTVDTPELTTEKHALFSAYLAYQHDDSMKDGFEDLRRFLYDSPVDSLEFCYRIGDRLIGVGIGDVSRRSLSSVYFIFDPAEARRSLGVYSVLWEIAWCAKQGLPYYYLGYFIRGCRRMSYKNQYHPYELLDQDGTWHREDSPLSALPDGEKAEIVDRDTRTA